MKISFRHLPVLLALLAILLSIPLIIFVKQQQELRGRAEVLPVSLYFTTTSCSNSPLSSLSLISRQQVSLLLCLNTQNTNVNGFDITASSSASLTFGGTTEGTDAQRFEVLIFNNRQQNGWRFTKVNTTIGETIAGRLYLAAVRFDASQVLGSGILRFQSFTVTSPTSPGPLSVTPTNITYTIIQPTPTPTNTPTPTPRPTATPTPTPTPIAEDVNRDGRIDIQDFNEWLYAYQHNGIPRNPNYRPDINNDRNVDIIDFNLWYRAML